jgi:hypothetical protein
MKLKKQSFFNKKSVKIRACLPPGRSSASSAFPHSRSMDVNVFDVGRGFRWSLKQRFGIKYLLYLLKNGDASINHWSIFW